MRELSLHVMDIVQNSISAEADLISIKVTEKTDKSKLIIEIEDNGRGMSGKQLEKSVDPFYTTRDTRNVGMGIPLFKLAAELTGGHFEISSELNLGTKISAEFLTNSVDMTPLGDINQTIGLLIKCNPNIDFVFKHTLDKKSLDLDTREIRAILGDIRLDSNDVTDWIKKYLAKWSC